MKRILCVSDMHCGGMSGVLPSNYYHADRDLHLTQSRVQEFLFDAWSNMCQDVGNNKEDQRDITKVAHHAVMSAVKTTYEPQYENGVVPRKRYMDENIMLNTVSFGHHKRGMRDDVEFEDLVRLSLAQGADLAMHERGVSDLYDRQNTINNMLTKHYIPAPQPTQEQLDEPQLEQFM